MTDVTVDPRHECKECLGWFHCRTALQQHSCTSHPLGSVWPNHGPLRCGYGGGGRLAGCAAMCCCPEELARHRAVRHPGGGTHLVQVMDEAAVRERGQFEAIEEARKARLAAAAKKKEEEEAETVRKRKVALGVLCYICSKPSGAFKRMPADKADRTCLLCEMVFVGSARLRQHQCRKAPCAVSQASCEAGACLAIDQVRREKLLQEAQKKERKMEEKQRARLEQLRVAEYKTKHMGQLLEWMAPDPESGFVRVPLHALRIHYMAGKLPGWLTEKLNRPSVQTNFEVIEGRTVVGEFHDDARSLEEWIMMELEVSPRATLRMKTRDVTLD